MSERSKPVIVFVCIENSCRSQIAEAFGKMFNQDTYEVKSAGSLPSGKLNPKAVESMADMGYDMSLHRSTSVNDLEHEKVDIMVSMGCGDACPSLLANQRIYWEIPDPKDLTLGEFSKVRDLIKDNVEKLFEELGIG